MIFDRVHVWDITALAKAFVGQTNRIQALDGRNGASYFFFFVILLSVLIHTFGLIPQPGNKYIV